MCIANGRTLGDIFGKYTCHQKKGSSVVDYLITPYKSLDNIAHFTVGDYMPNLSDHCPLLARIRTKSTIEEKLFDKVDLQDIPSRYIWNDKADETFRAKLDSSEFKEEVKKILSAEDNPSLPQDIQDLLTGAADSCDIKKTKVRKCTPDPPWFDLECKSLKNNIRQLGKTLRKEPYNTAIRESLYIDKNTLRNKIKRNMLWSPSKF